MLLLVNRVWVTVALTCTAILEQLGEPVHDSVMLPLYWPALSADASTVTFSEVGVDPEDALNLIQGTVGVAVMENLLVLSLLVTFKGWGIVVAPEEAWNDSEGGFATRPGAGDTND